MTVVDTSLLGQMDDYILDGKYHEATDTFCRLAASGHDVADLITHAMRTASPYLHVPSHHKLLPNGEFRNVNYDHTILGVRAGMRLMPYLSEEEKYLTLVQAMYYVPQGLDVWAQLECGFPGHYAREQEQCAEDEIGHELYCHFEDQSLYDHAGFLLGLAFKGGQYRLHETNTALLSEAEQDHFIGQILEGDALAVAHAVTDLLRAGKSLQSIHDTVMIAHATHCLYRLRTPIAYTAAMHSYDYCNVINHWLRNYQSPHQAKAVYLGAWFVTDIIHEIDWYPDMPGAVKPDATPFKGWAEGLALDKILAELEMTIAAQDASRSVALVQSYVERTSERDRLIRMLVHCAGKYQGDAHIFRNASSHIEEYTHNTSSEARKNILFMAWAHYLSFYRKRTLATDCYDMYHRHFNGGASYF